MDHCCSSCDRLPTSDSTTGGWTIFSKGGATEVAGDNHNWLLTYDKNTFNDDQAGNGWAVLFERSDSAEANVSAKYVVDVAAGETHLVMDWHYPGRQIAFTDPVLDVDGDFWIDSNFKWRVIRDNLVEYSFLIREV
jgi:hypothetical protein